jgi:hypothetical protein
MGVSGPIVQPGLAGRYPLLAVELGARRRDVRFGASVSVGSLAAVGRSPPAGRPHWPLTSVVGITETPIRNASEQPRNSLGGSLVTEAGAC